MSIMRGWDYFVIDITVFKCCLSAKFGRLTQRNREEKKERTQFVTPRAPLAKNSIIASFFIKYLDLYEFQDIDEESKYAINMR